MNFKQIYLIILKVIFSFTLCACAIEHKRAYDEDRAMKFYLSEKQTIEMPLVEAINKCRQNYKAVSASIRLNWNLNEDGQATDILISNDSLRCREANRILREHLKDLQFPRPQPLDRIQFEYEYKF
jgi:hypothetical protein